MRNEDTSEKQLIPLNLMEQLKLKHFLGRSKQHVLLTTFLYHSICFCGNFKRRGLSLRIKQLWQLFVQGFMMGQTQSKELQLALFPWRLFKLAESCTCQCFGADIPAWLNTNQESGSLEGTEPLSRDTAATSFHQGHCPAQSWKTRICLLLSPWKNRRLVTAALPRCWNEGGVEGWRSDMVR